MKISDLIVISQSITDDRKAIKKLNRFIESMGYGNVDFTPKQIYALVDKFDLFYADNGSFSDLNQAASPLIDELQKCVIKEIASDLLKKELNEKSYGLKNAIALMTRVRREGYLTEKNFVYLISKGPNAFLALDTFSILQSYGVPLNDKFRKIIIDLYAKLLRIDILTIRSILLDLARGGYLTKELFLVVLMNPYKKWHPSQGYALSELCQLNLLDQCQNYVLRDAEQAGIIAAGISVLSKLPLLWSTIQKELAENPDSAKDILEMHYKEYEASVKNQLRIHYPHKEEYEINIICFNHMINLNEEKPFIETKKAKKNSIEDMIKKIGIFHSRPAEVKGNEDAKKEFSCLIM